MSSQGARPVRRIHSPLVSGQPRMSRCSPSSLTATRHLCRPHPPPRALAVPPAELRPSLLPPPAVAPSATCSYPNVGPAGLACFDGSTRSGGCLRQSPARHCRPASGEQWQCPVRQPKLRSVPNLSPNRLLQALLAPQTGRWTPPHADRVSDEAGRKQRRADDEVGSERRTGDCGIWRRWSAWEKDPSAKLSFPVKLSMDRLQQCPDLPHHSYSWAWTGCPPRSRCSRPRSQRACRWHGCRGRRDGPQRS